MPSGTEGWAGGRIDARNQSQQIVQHHKEQDAGDEGLEALVAVADDLVGLAAGELVHHLRDLLRRIGLLHRQRQPHEKKRRSDHRPPALPAQRCR
jgi:hypothetical protein